MISDCLTSLSSPDLIYTAGFQLLKRIVAQQRIELEELEPSKLIGPQQDVETVESWADRNGLTYGTARAWTTKGVLPTVKLGKRCMVMISHSPSPGVRLHLVRRRTAIFPQVEKNQRGAAYLTYAYRVKGEQHHA